MSSVPAGWTRTTLGELGRYLNGRAFKKSEWADSGRPIIRIQNLTGTGATYNYFQGEVEDRYVARPGDLLVSWAATLGAYLWTGPEAVVNQHIFKVESNIDRRFHKYLLDYKLDELMRHTHGSGMVHITRGKFDAVPVVIPETQEEQQRIVTILEDHLSRLDAAVGVLQEVARRTAVARASALSRLSASGDGCRPLTLDEATRGGLFRDGDWVETKDQDPSGDVRLTQLADVGEGHFRDRSDRWLRRDQAESLGCTYLETGDVLVARMPDPLARACLVPPDLGPAVTAVDVAICRLRRRDVDPEWFMWALNAPSFRAQATTKQTGTTRKRISRRNLAGLVVHVPSVEVQRSRVAEFMTFSESLDRILGQLHESLGRVDALRRALLAAAFSGQLSAPESPSPSAEELSGA